MAVPTIALYASPPSSVCSTPHPCQINAHATYDFELSSRSSSPAPSTASTSQKPVVGGLSCLFSSHSVKHPSSSSSFSGGGEELGSLWHDRGEELKELSSSFRYSPSKFNGAFLSRDQSPVSVFQGPVSWSSSGVSGSARSPPTRIAREKSNNGDINLQNSFRGGSSGLFNGFVSGALESSCIDYDSPSFEVPADVSDVVSSTALVDELTFNMDVGFLECNSKPYAKDLLLSAQSQHKIFCEEFVVKAFYEAEKAHRGQVSFISKFEVSLFRLWAVLVEMFCIVLFYCRCDKVAIHICSIVWKRRSCLR